MGGVLFYKSEVLVCCTRTFYDPVSHTSNSTASTCTDGTTERTVDEGLGANIWCCSSSAFCQTGDNNGKSWNSPSYLYQREIQPGEPVSLEGSDLEEQQEKKRATRRRGRWDVKVRFPEAVMKNRPTTRPHVMLARFHL